MSSIQDDTAIIFLAIGDDSSRDSIACGLVAAGYSVKIASVEELMRHKPFQADCDVMILDFAIGNLLQKHINDPYRPISILLTDEVRAESTIFALQEFGADACLDRHVDIGVLVATIKSLRRRVAMTLLPETVPRTGEETNIWHVSKTNWTISCPRGF